MARACTFLALLLLLLTFNAYACVLPLQPQSAMDCPSTAEQPVRQTCDAFLELGPHSQVPSHHSLTTINLEACVISQLPTAVFDVFPPEQPPLGAESPIHLSIPTTVLRI